MDFNNAGKPGLNGGEGRLQELQQATMEILTNLAETDNLPWAVQMALLSIISTTGVQSGAIRLSDEEDYAFSSHENIENFGKETFLDCTLDGELRLFNISEKGRTLPCMFSRELFNSGSFFCTNISGWDEAKANSFPVHTLSCRKCMALGYKTAVMVPIKTAGEVLGLIHLYDYREKAVSADDLAFLETISGPLGYALKHLQDRESIRKSEEQFRFLAENARDIIFRLQVFPEKKFIYVSPASAYISGYSPEEYYADGKFDKKLFHPADYPKYKSIISSSTDSSEPFILRLVRKDGQVIWVELHCTPVYNRNRVEIIEGIARDITERVQSELELKSSYKQLKVFSSMILKAQEDERVRLSRELHDEIGQALTAVKIDLQVVKEELKKQDSGSLERLTESIGLVDSTLERVRKQAVSLRPPALDHMGLVAAVQNMARGFSRRTGIETEVTAANGTSRFSDKIETALFRCIQESLTNAARHSRAKNVTVELRYHADSIYARIEDNGNGFKPELLDENSNNLGLVGMQERVKLLNGVFKIDSAPGRGTRITITIPLQ